MGAQVKTSCTAKPRCCVAAAKLENTVPGGVVLPLPPLDAAVPFGLAPPETFHGAGAVYSPPSLPGWGPRRAPRQPRPPHVAPGALTYTAHTRCPPTHTPVYPCVPAISRVPLIEVPGSARTPHPVPRLDPGRPWSGAPDPPTGGGGWKRWMKVGEKGD